MKTKATVIKTSGNRALVRAVRQSACEGCDACSSKGSCHAEIMLSESPKSYELEVDNSIGASAGDFVEIQSDGNVPLFFALVIFLLPIVLTVVFATFAGQHLDSIVNVLCSVGVFVLSFVLCSFVVNRFSARYNRNSICKIIKENSK